MVQNQTRAPLQLNEQKSNLEQVELISCKAELAKMAFIS
jgi:hypothetical protein